MTEAQVRHKIFTLSKKREIDWAQYLDFTRFIESEENEKLRKFQKDLLIKVFQKHVFF